MSGQGTLCSRCHGSKLTPLRFEDRVEFFFSGGIYMGDVIRGESVYGHWRLLRLFNSSLRNRRTSPWFEAFFRLQAKGRDAMLEERKTRSAKAKVIDPTRWRWVAFWGATVGAAIAVGLLLPARRPSPNWRLFPNTQSDKSRRSGYPNRVPPVRGSKASPDNGASAATIQTTSDRDRQKVFEDLQKGRIKPGGPGDAARRMFGIELPPPTPTPDAAPEPAKGKEPKPPPGSSVPQRGG